MEITVKDSEVREEAMRRVMWTVGNTKNPVTDYIADAVAKRVVMDEAEFAVEATGTEALNIMKALSLQTSKEIDTSLGDRLYGACPSCGRIYQDHYHVYNYCECCGQKLKMLKDEQTKI